MKKFNSMILVNGVYMDGMQNYEARDFLHAVEVALAYASTVGGRVVRVESCDFGAFEFMR